MDLIEKINMEFGYDIFCNLLGFEPKNKENIRLFDTSKTSQDIFYIKGSRLSFPHVHNYSENKTYTPITAYKIAHNLTSHEVIEELKQKYIIGINTPQRIYTQKKAPEIKPLRIDVKEVNESILNRHKSNFIKFLRSMYDTDIVKQALQFYQVGHGMEKYDTIFWYQDKTNTLKNGKYFAYNQLSGKRVKETHPNWYHSLKGKEKPLVGFYGEHLLQDTIWIVESEKTAIIIHIHLHLLESENSDICVWACGGLNQLRSCFLNCSQNITKKEIILIPDTDSTGKSFAEWEKKSVELSKEFNLNITISDFLENEATSLQKERKYDLADFYISKIVYQNPELESILDCSFYLLASSEFIPENDIYVMWYEWYKNTEYVHLSEFYKFILVCGSEITAKEQISKYLKDAEIKGYSTEKLNTWSYWLDNPKSVPHPKRIDF
jgi:hypothetical protein